MSIFNQIKGNRQKRTAFNLSHDRKISMKMGDLVPVLQEEVLPGDSWNISTQSFIRLAPQIAPVMHKVDTYIHYFFVPNRIIWDEWEGFITGSAKTTFPPKLEDCGNIIKGSLADHLGLPIMTEERINNESITQLPFRAYHTIYNEYYRDQNLQIEWNVTENGSINTIHKRAWEKDYFTSALPWTQKGGEGIIPINGIMEPEYKTYSDYYDTTGGAMASGPSKFANSGVSTSHLVDTQNKPSRVENLADEQEISGEITINEFRIAHRIQKWFERQARAGSRYTETLLSHFGTNTGDARLQRPEYLGGGKTPVMFSEVLNTNGQETENVPQGHMSGHGISVGTTAKCNKTFNEHGYIIGIMSVMPKPAYQQGLHKSWTRKDKFDFYWPEFAHLGEQEVQNKELYVDPLSEDPDEETTFGYQSRYAEYKYKGNSVHGDMKDSLSFYHMGRIFDTAPVLNEDFIECDTRSINQRVFAAGDLADQLWINIHHNIIARRPMPYYGTPTI